MSLANVISLQSGTNFIINVAAAQLSSDVTEKDFTVLHNGTAVANVSYNKTTPTTLQYVGASLPSTTIEIRRKTSFDQAKNLVTYANRFSSTKWNESLLRIQRWEEEVDLNGAGSIGAGVIPIPANDPYGSIWTNDTIYSPTRKVLWDKIQTLATKASPALTGVPTAPTAAFTNSSTQLATTAHVKDVLGNTPAITNPVVSNGSFTSPTITTPAITGGTLTNVSSVTQGVTDNSTQIATTAWSRLLINNLLAVNTNSFKLPPNIFVQFGSVVAVTNAGGAFTVAFPTVFASLFTVLAVNGDSAATTCHYPIISSSTSTFNCTTSPLSTSIPLRVNWIAIGTY